LLARLISGNIDKKYLHFLNGSAGWNLAASYYTENLKTQAATMQLTNIFIFDADFKILVQSAGGLETGNSDSRLLLNRTEIQALNIGQSAASLPFKGADNQWYLWGFYRLDEDHWLGIQESAARLAKVESLSQFFWGIGVAGVLLTMLAGWLLAHNIARPINRLVNFSSLLGKGHFSAPVPENVSGELAILANALDKMRHGLARHHQEKEAMLAQIAHEIRNPLGGMELLAGLVKEDLQQKNSSTEYIQKILEEIAGLKSLITAYLNYSRPAPANPEPVNVSELVNEVQNLFKNQLTEKRVGFSHNGHLALVRFDRNHLRQILINLISNSLEMIDGGGNIRIETQQNGRKTEIVVSDDGPGIPEENLPNIFEPFFTTRPNGTGLGLAICKKLCRENKAAITAENNPQKGCTFTLLLDKS
jgi:signal transduction histidine kinase